MNTMSNAATPTQASAAAKAGRITLAIFKYTGLVFAWLFQYTMWVPFVAVPVWIIGKLGKVAMVVLCCTVIGIIPVIIYLALTRNAAKKERRSMWKPWFTK